MSAESVRAFIERIKTDQEFAKRVAECKSKDERMTFVKDNGFNFSPDELSSLTMEMTDDELTMISGGQLAACRRRNGLD